MKKSPGKWIKTVLFGKKISKSSLSKNATPDKKPDVKVTVVDPAGDSEPPHFTDRGVENIEIEKSLSDGSPCVTNTLDPQNNIVSVQLSDDEMQRQDEAATKTQAAFRGYLARRAFRALKGIIRLQALIRGHLVRRQAIATLRCMQAIVKLQALARGRKDAKLDIGSNTFFPLATNPFICMLLVSLPTAMPLSLQYEPAEPNSSWNWLERWSLSHFWELPTKTKKILNSKPQKKHSNAQNPEPDSGKSKRTIRKVSTAINGDSSALSSLEMEKPKRNPKKIIHHQIESVQEHPQNELERVKRNLKKVTASAAAAAAASEKSETETEKTVPISEKEILIISEKLSDSDIAEEKPVLLEASSEKIKIVEPVHVQDNDTPVVETNCSENDEKMENSPNLQEELGSKEEESGQENQKIRKRRSLPAKLEYTENISQNNPSRPSYMAATESAKAKLRAQGSAKINEDGVEYGNVRRHSLPASTNGKMSSMSPRIQKPVQANGKGGGKTNKMLIASKDDKVLLPGWRR